VVHDHKQLASLKGNVDIARLLLDSGADLYAESLDRGTALDYAQGISNFHERLRWYVLVLYLTFD
jgi:hypothetical protein